jgi:hypothetical protein
LVFLVVSFILASPPISCMHSSVRHSCYMSCTSHLPWLNYSNYAWQRVQVTKFLNMQVSPTSCHLIPLRFKHSPQSMFSNILSIRSSFTVRDEISHPYRTTGKIILSYYIFTFFGQQRRTQIFWTER